ncbi:type I polyketide synthase [Streptomyces sp. ML-6]|uniref:type I polyketide synthase n=1 Tax=Streptomyces sp. ML-6 TaxID=2982693 RepID=UPI0024BF1112|nr:type I polyketide synthase [Streptomyces sp. ML-6]MDK0517987.1 phosphopantetheine-binding protein [Streptomyces sp. ML-6]
MTDLMTSVMGLLARGHIDRRTAQELLDAVGSAGAEKQPEPRPSGDVAVIGVAAQLPGAATYERFWDVLVAGEDRVEPAPARRRELCEPVLTGTDTEPSFLHAAWLDDIDRFDAELFGVTPADARLMDPQQRRFLQVAYHCLEDAGRAGRIRGTRTGVYVSAALGDYSSDLMEITPSAVPGILPSFAASRLSFLFDLRGPAFVSSATCASSLLVLHEACLGLRNGDCDTALVGGVNIFSLPLASEGRLMDAAGITSDDHRCRPFDHHGTGIGRGEGAVAVLLKPLEHAVRDGDRVRAVIRGSAVNNDGASAMMTAPNPKAHTELLLDAWRRAGVSPEALSYLETHGTGTALGDPIEIRGITDAVRRHTGRRQFIAIGSVKGNIGHLVDGVAGLSALVKTMLVLEHGSVPPTVNLQEPNGHIDFLDSPVFVPTTRWNLRTGARSREPLRAGVSCFGFNGTNVHVVLEEAPRQETESVAETPGRDSGVLVYPVSARTRASLRALMAAHGGHTGAGHSRDLAFSLWNGREHHRHRVAILARDRAEFARTCRTLAGTDNRAWAELPGVRVAEGPCGDPDSPEEALAYAYVTGKEVRWHDLFETGPPPVLVGLPLYPFDEDSFWFGAPVGRPLPSGPADDTLTALLAVVGRALGYEDVTAADSFIGLGGTSLSAMQIQTELLREHAWKVDVADLLGAEDFTELAAVVDAAAAPATGATEAPTAPQATGGTPGPTATT